MIEIHQLEKISPMDKRPVEIVERKGIGHPDTICDEIGEKISLYLTKYYYENFGVPLHFNIDKCVLVGGRSQPQFGGGIVLEPILLHFVGRATLHVYGELEKEVPIGVLVRSAAFDWFSENFRYLDPLRHVSIIYSIRPGSTDLRKLFEAVKDSPAPLANDTSIGVGFAPLSETERVCLGAEQLLNSREFKRRYPAVGEDIKVMAVRRNDKIRLTVAMAAVDRELSSLDDYLSLKESVKSELYEHLSKLTDRELYVEINTADNPQKGIYYLTVTGTSAEAGDDGQIGRGNRWNGLITPLRYMSIEAHSGKNPVSHVGKIYQYAAQKAAENIQKELCLDEVYVVLVSTIGKPITEPQMVYVEYIGEEGGSNVKSEITSIVEEVLKSLPNFWRRYIEGKL
ncbi:MAG: methionine adenosyltransferase [Crenarchaeota archaeon]|nr:methionine adenosyltransferase [Thermoproteota archaeon]MCR8453480.1 methionine adenosyltransferase [Thermoproteota archaeon]MCR8462761.1 methionine adenosyltransferase [Thermoproteota archaeon]MCR8470544.1 methionine adenosyltransferase [Thermoproteota archaeon]MCR8471539.1 methionine adenosyltransferase [Thermoproteota archaeon]